MHTSRPLLIGASLALLVVIGLVAWQFIPSDNEAQACQAVYDQLRRQINNPALADIDSCDEATITPGESGTYKITAYYESNGERFIFAGQAWKSAQGWEATISPPSRVVNQ